MGRVAMLLQRRPDGNSRLIEAVHVQVHQPNGESLFLRATFNMPGPGVATHGMVWYGIGKWKTAFHGAMQYTL